MQSPITILIISDRTEAELLRQMIVRIDSKMTVLVADKAELVIQHMNDTFPDVIFCDWQLEELNPSAYCKNILNSEHFSSVYLIALLNSNEELHHAYAIGCHEAHLFEVNKTAYYKILTALRTVSSLKHLRLQNEQLNLDKEKLDASLDEVGAEFRTVIERMISARLPIYSGAENFIRRASEWIGASMFTDEDEAQKKALSMAIGLVALGRISLSDTDKYAPVSYEGSPTTPVLAHVPLEADGLLQGCSLLDSVRMILRNLYENYDGTGFPDRKQHWQIPLGARILRAVSEFHELRLFHSHTTESALNHIKRLSRHVYDHRVVALLEEFCSYHESDTHEIIRCVGIHELAEGMKIKRDIITNSGMKLIPAGTLLQTSLISRILSHNSLDPIIGNIYIE
jgi:response regulator RpfG family c-di-GMP phosphodiesterase